MSDCKLINYWWPIHSETWQTAQGGCRRKTKVTKQETGWGGGGEVDS